MASHHVTVAPGHDYFIVAVAGVRSDEAARGSSADVLEMSLTTGLDRIIFDTRSAILPIKPAALVARALDFGAKLPRSRIAIVADTCDDTFARLWRKGLAETGHDAIVFTDASAAQAWLLNQADAETVYLT